MGTKLQSSYLPIATFNVSMMIAVNNAESDRPGNREPLADNSYIVCMTIL